MVGKNLEGKAAIVDDLKRIQSLEGNGERIECIRWIRWGIGFMWMIWRGYWSYG